MSGLKFWVPLLDVLASPFGGDVLPSSFYGENVGRSLEACVRDGKRVLFFWLRVSCPVSVANHRSEYLR